MSYKVKIISTASLSLFVFLFATLAQTDELSIRAFVDKKSIFIGDRVKYTIEAKERDIEIELPKFEDGKIGDFEIKDRGSDWYDITTYTVGKHLIPPINIRYRQRGAKDWDIQKTQQVTVTVESLLPKKEKAKDIKDIKGPIYFYQMNWILVFSALVILVMCIVSVIVYKKKKRKIQLRLPHETALEELEAIKGLLARTGDVKEYYIRISDCTRHYIERSFKLKAPEMTTEEFLVSLKDSTALSVGHKSLLKSFLEACDLVKFAKYAPTKTEAESVYLAAKKFVEETKEVASKTEVTR